MVKIRAKKSLGQNFLQDENIIEKIVRSLNLKEDDNVVEIGPGMGAITKKVLKKVKKLNVIEFDTQIIPTLERECNNLGLLHIFNEDILEFDFNKISHDKNIKLIGNLPYNISSPILMKVIEIKSMLESATFMLQKEMVDRIVACPNNKTYGRLSVIIQYNFECESLFTIKPQAFYPQPKIDSKIIRLIPKRIECVAKDYKFFSEVVKLAFSQRRKKLSNNLKNMLEYKNRKQEEFPVDLSLRAENLSVDDFVRLSNFLMES